MTFENENPVIKSNENKNSERNVENSFSHLPSSVIEKAKAKIVSMKSSLERPYNKEKELSGYDRGCYLMGKAAIIFREIEPQRA